MSVKLDAQDRLCLDGQRLMLISGTYGATGAVYRTEIESYVRVEQTGAISSTTSSFTVKYDDGRVAYYGSDVNSRHIPDGANVLTWLLRRVQDTATNSVIYNYTNVAAEVLLADIKYTGRGATAGDRKVMFTWEDRPDDSVSYLAGAATRQTKRLSMISTWYTTLAVREYRFSYGTDSVASGRSLLASVEECAYQASTLYCLPATTLQWSAPTNPQNVAISFDAPSWATTETSDGKAGRIPGGAGDPQTALGMQVGSAVSTEGRLYETQPGASFAGKGARQLWYQSGGAVQMLKFDSPTQAPTALAAPAGVTWPEIGQSIWTYLPEPRDQYGDFNNDGRTDILDFAEVRIVLVDANGNPTGWQENDAKTAAPGDAAIAGIEHKVADFDGDGKLDVVTLDNVAAGGQPDDYRIFLYRNVTPSLNVGANDTFLFAYPRVPLHDPPEYAFQTQGQTFYERAQLVRVEDTNGDGRPDIVFKSKYHNLSSTPPAVDKVLVNNTVGGTPSYTTAGSQMTDPDDHYLTGDVNGDGLLDIIHRETGQLWRVKINKGTSYAASESTGIEVDPIECQSLPDCSANPGSVGRIATRTGDIDNDGRDELFVPIARVATICLADQTYQDQEGEWVVEDLCGNRLPPGAGHRTVRREHLRVRGLPDRRDEPRQLERRRHRHPLQGAGHGVHGRRRQRRRPERHHLGREPQPADVLQRGDGLHYSVQLHVPDLRQLFEPRGAVAARYAGAGDRRLWTQGGLGL
jgi:hypothetical protein